MAVAETHIVHFEEFDAVVTVDVDGMCELVLRRTAAESDPISLDSKGLAAICAMWERATREPE